MNPHEPPADTERLFAEAVEHHRAKRFDDAKTAYESVLDRWPTHILALSNLGVLHAGQGRNDEAIRCYTLALAADPSHADTHFNFGNFHRRAQDLIEALKSYEECLLAAPQHASAHYNLALVASQLGMTDRAVRALQAVVQLEPTNGDAQLRLADLYVRTGQAETGVAMFREYVQQFPQDPRGFFNLGLALANHQKAGEAVEHFHKALKMKPNYADAHNALGLALEILGRKDDAVFHYEQAVQWNPEQADAWCNMGTNLMEQGRTEDAQTCLRQSLQVRPNAPAVHSNLLLVMNYSSQLSRDQIRDEHFAWGDRFTSPVQPRPTALEPHDAERKLRIGYISADCRHHPVAGFLEACLKQHDRSKYEVFLYAQIMKQDDITERLKSLADHWRPITGMSDREAAEQIERDAVDVLIDTGGHTAGNRLLVFAYRPAAVQATVFGYPNTSGMPAMDYRITDEISDPIDATESLYREELIRLPAMPWVYHAPEDAPEVMPLPALSKKQFTFACLNNAAKISEACLEAWSKMIQSILGSKLILLAGGSPTVMKRLTDRFVRAGILRERIQVIERLPRDRYFAMYNTIDLALDPFPYNGGITTCDAMYMGVPVLTLAGDSYVSRQGVLQNIHVGLPEFIADSPQTLIDIARHWTKNRPALAEIRAGLRERLTASPIMNAGHYVQQLEEALRTAWVKHAIPEPK